MAAERRALCRRIGAQSGKGELEFHGVAKAETIGTVQEGNQKTPTERPAAVFSVRGAAGPRFLPPLRPRQGVCVLKFLFNAGCPLSIFSCMAFWLVGCLAGCLPAGFLLACMWQQRNVLHKKTMHLQVRREHPVLDMHLHACKHVVSLDIGQTSLLVCGLCSSTIAFIVRVVFQLHSS